MEGEGEKDQNDEREKLQKYLAVETIRMGWFGLFFFFFNVRGRSQKHLLRTQAWVSECHQLT